MVLSYNLYIALGLALVILHDCFNTLLKKDEVWI